MVWETFLKQHSGEGDKVSLVSEEPIHVHHSRFSFSLQQRTLFEFLFNVLLHTCLRNVRRILHQADKLHICWPLKKLELARTNSCGES